MSDVLRRAYGNTLAVRPPVPATANKAGANYKSEVAHLEYSPRRAYDEWLAICEGIISFGGDAIFDFEPEDEPLLDVEALAIDPDGTIHAAGSTEKLGSIEHVHTGRVFAANGPWVIVDGDELQVLMPHMLAHRTHEAPYYQRLFERIAADSHLELALITNPHRWEGMADVAIVGDKVVFTYTVEGHYDETSGRKSIRSSRKGVEFAAEFAEIEKEKCVFVELVFPHFHGDTVHFGARTPNRGPALVHYPGGLWRNDASKVAKALGEQAIIPIEREDAVEKYAGNSRQIGDGVLVPDGVSDAFISSLESLGLSTKKVALFELFGKAGGGPACATLYLPNNLVIPDHHPFRYSVRRKEAQARRERIAEKLTVDPEFFKGKTRG